MGIKMLSKFQIGRETTAGTAAAATIIWGGENVVAEDQKPRIPVMEDVGQLFRNTRTYVPYTQMQITIPDTPATFEQLPHIFEMGVRTDTPAAEGSGYIYEYVFPLTSENTIKTYTVEYGDNIDAGEAEYVFCTKFTLKGAAKEEVTIGATLLGRQNTDTTFTSLSVEGSLEVALFNKAKLYIDATGGTVGTTQKTSCFLGFEIDVETGLQPVYTGDGSLYYTFVKCIGPKIKGKLLLEHDATGLAEREIAEAGTVRLLRIQVDGAALTTAGATYTYKAIRYSSAIQYTSVPNIDEQDGDTVIELPWEPVYSDSLTPTFIVVNVKSSL